MKTEDDLRAQLHQEAASVRPPDDLIPTLAAGHAHRHRRAARMKMGGVAVATVLVVTAMATVFAASGPVDPATSGAEILKRARQMDDASRDMVIHETTTDGSGARYEGWVLRSTGQARFIRQGVLDSVYRPDGDMVLNETIDFTKRTVRTFRGHPLRGQNAIDAVTGMISFKDWYDDKNVTVDLLKDGLVRLRMRDGVLSSPGASLLLDARSYRPTRLVRGNVTVRFDWQPPTSHARESLTHQVPPGFRQEDGPVGVDFPPGTGLPALAIGLWPNVSPVLLSEGAPPGTDNPSGVTSAPPSSGDPTGITSVPPSSTDPTGTSSNPPSTNSSIGSGTPPPSR